MRKIFFNRALALPPAHPELRARLFLTIAFMLISSPVFAHGVGYREISLKAIPLEFFYSTGERMSFCEAKIFSPGDPKFAAQSGRTNEQGQIAFIPDSIGEWRVIVNDGQGHQCEAKINITEEFLKTESTLSLEQNHEGDSPRGFELYIRALLGVSLIFNAALLTKGVRKSK